MQKQSAGIGSDFKRKRRRIKLRCLVCREVFDDDHSPKHNQRKHAQLLAQNKFIVYEQVNAIANPFAFSQRKMEVKLRISFLHLRLRYKKFRKLFSLGILNFVVALCTFKVSRLAAEKLLTFSFLFWYVIYRVVLLFLVSFI